jgi:hypothetical protein
MLLAKNFVNSVADLVPVKFLQICVPSTDEMGMNLP